MRLIYIYIYVIFSYTTLLFLISVHPGGWAPSSVLRTLAQREFPKFMKTFSSKIVEKYKDKPIAFSGLEFERPEIVSHIGVQNASFP